MRWCVAAVCSLLAAATALRPVADVLQRLVRRAVLALIGRAPRAVAQRLRQLRDGLRQIRDEIALLASRNEALIAQVLMFTDHLGQSLAATEDSAYTAAGGLADKRERLASGGLFTSAL